MATSVGLSSFMPIRSDSSSSSTISPPPPSCSSSTKPPSQHQQQQQQLKKKRQSLSDQLQHLSKDFLDSPPPSRSWTSTSRRKARDFGSDRKYTSPGTMRFATPAFSDALTLLEKAEETEESVANSLDDKLDGLNTKDVVAILSAQHRWRKAFLFYKCLKSNSFKLNSFCYNVMLRILRKAEQWEDGKAVVEEMTEKGVPPDNVTYSTIISFAIRCGKIEEALEYFEKMQEADCSPDSVTYCSVIEALAKSGRMQEATELCSKMQEDVKPLDMVAYSQIIKLHGMQRSFSKMLEVYKDMQSENVIPNVVVYNSMITVLSAAGRSQQVKGLFNDMLGHGLKPSPITLSLLFRTYTKSRSFDEANELFTRIQREGWAVDVVVYNSMLSLCTQTGRIQEGEEVIKELLDSNICKPDDWTWKIMIDMYVKGGKYEDGKRIAKQMVSKGRPIDLAVYMSLIQGYGKIKDFKGVVELFDEVQAANVPLDHMLGGALLSALVLCQEEDDEDYSAILGRIEVVYPKLRSFLDSLSQEGISKEKLKKDFRGMLNGTTFECRRPFCNMLLDLCWAKNMEKTAHFLFSVAVSFGIYKDLQIQSHIEWCLKLRTLSFGAARCALQGWMSTLRIALQKESNLPELLSIEVGVGAQLTPGDSVPVMSTFVLKLLQETNAPFQEGKSGWLTSNKSDVKGWLSSVFGEKRLLPQEV